MIKLFGEYAGITVREEIVKPQSELEIILEVEREILETYKKDERLTSSKEKEEHDIYSEIFLDVKKKLKDFSVDRNHLQAYISARENTLKDSEALLRGMYSGTLLEIVCAHTKEEIIIDGENKKVFNHLFERVRYAQNITIRNIEGYSILGNAASYEGRIEQVTLKNLRGDCIFVGSGRNKGSVENVYLEDISTDNLFHLSGSNGSVQKIKGKNISGESLFSRAGESGILKDISFDTVRGNYLFQNAANEKGLAENISLTNISGNYLFSKAGRNKGILRNISLSNCKGDQIFAESGKNGFIENINLTNCSGFGIFNHAGTDEGTLQNIVLQDISSDMLFSWAGSESGVIKNIVAIHTQGQNAFEYVGNVLPFKNKKEPQSKNIIIGNHQGICLLDHAGERETPLLNVLTEGELLREAFRGSHTENVLAAETISDKQKNMLEEIKKLARGIAEKSISEQEQMHNEIARLQKEIFKEENT